MLLTSIASLRTELGFDDMTDINDAIKDALDAADALLQARLSIDDFARVTRTDVFYVPETQLGATRLFRQSVVARGRLQSIKFRLRRGFVSNVVVSRVFDQDDFGTANATVYTSDCMVDAIKGIVEDTQTLYDREYVGITYDSGFTVSGSDPTSYDLTEVPNRLQQAAKLWGKILLADAAPVKAANLMIDTKLLTTTLNALLAQMVRYAPTALLPM
jgi:hypothetical protein